MDQQNISTLAGVVNATEDFLKSQIAQKDERIQQLEEHIQRVTQRDYDSRATLQRVVDGMHEWTLDSLEEGAIEESQAEEISEICSFELTKEFEVEVTVTYSVMVNARTAGDAESAVSDIDFESVSYNDDVISYLSCNVDSIDI
jgi:hypothetical protein